MTKFLKKYVLFMIAGLLLIASVVHIAYLAAGTITNREAHRLTFPGTSQLELDPGKYMICYEYDNHKVKKQLGMLTIETGMDLSLSSSDIQVELTNLNDNTQIMLHPDQAFSYAFNNKSGHSLYSFNVKEQGDYQIMLQRSDVENLELISITLLNSPVSKILGLLKMIGLYILLIAIFIISGVIVLLKGKKHHNYKIQ